MDRRLIIQGYPGCFHEEAAVRYFGTTDLELVPSNSFPELAGLLLHNQADHLAIIAIENSIAGTLLQNYRILRENRFRVIGEVYLRIKHNLMALPGQDMEDIVEVRSHPMAIYQCLSFFEGHKAIKLVESVDTALSAKEIAETNTRGTGAIASTRAAEIYGLEILQQGIETSKKNYTRFFIVQGENVAVPKGDFNKASIYVRVSHEKGSLMRVLDEVVQQDINLSKLQSYPVLGEMNQYYFHLDLEFDDQEQFHRLDKRLEQCTLTKEIMGIYQKAPIDDH